MGGSPTNLPKGCGTCAPGGGPPPGGPPPPGNPPPGFGGGRSWHKYPSPLLGGSGRSGPPALRRATSSASLTCSIPCTCPVRGFIVGFSICATRSCTGSVIVVISAGGLI